ncbi:MAG: hypothetical protein IRY99_20005 [Isosphaeraceae bacterium]|nr:hypothetical protein [Isosphaeraceae bacterium]
MSSALSRLTEMVRQVETKSRAQKLGAETQKAAERFRAAEERASQAERRFREERPARERELEQVGVDEVQLKELIRKIAQLMATGALAPEESKAFEKEIEATRAELETRRKAAQAELDAIVHEAEEARRELRSAREQYQQLRRELDELRPELARDFSDIDQLIAEAERNSPVAQLHALAQEIADGERHFGMLDPREQAAQLKIWIGRYRLLQDRFNAERPPEATEEDLTLLHQTFPRLVGISKVYWPGYIEAFSRNFTTDWERYIEEAQEELRLAAELARRNRDLEGRRQQQQDLFQEQRRQAREAGRLALEELRRLVVRPDFPADGLDQFHALLGDAIRGLGTSDPELIGVVRPYRDLLNGKEFRALRRHLDLAYQAEARAEGEQALRDEFRDLIAQTHGMRVLMIGGAAREESRRALEQFFEFGELEWESHEGTRPALLKSLEERIRNRGMDLVLVLKEFVGHIVPGRLRPLCEQYGIPCLMVEKGYGTRQVAETLRAGLIKPARDDGTTGQKREI